MLHFLSLSDIVKMSQKVLLLAILSHFVIISCKSAVVPDIRSSDHEMRPREFPAGHFPPKRASLHEHEEMKLPNPTNTPVNTRNKVTKDGMISYGPLDQVNEYRLPPYLAGVRENAQLAFFLEIAQTIVSRTTSTIDVLDLYQDFKDGRLDVMKIVKMSWPFAAVGVIGILFIILCLLCCPFVCCCRSCGKCGARVKFSKARRQKRCTVLVWVFLIMVTCCFLLFGGGGAYLMAARVYNTGPHMIQTADKAFDDVLIMKNDIFRNLKQLGEEDFGFTVETMINTVKNTGSVVSGPLMDTVKPDFDQMIEGLDTVDTGSSTLRTSISSANKASQDLIDHATSLEVGLEDLRSQMRSAASSCSGAFCSILPSENIIPVPQDFSQTPDLSQQNQGLSDLDATNVKDISNKAKSVFDEIPVMINTKAASTITMVESALNGVTTQISTYIQSAKDTVEKILDENLLPLKGNLHSLSEIISNFKSYFDYGGIGIAGFCAVIVLAVLLAVFGGCCTTHYRSQVLHRKASSRFASFLTCLLSFCLVFVIIFFLLASAFFFVSGALSVTCKGLESPSTIDELVPVDLGNMMYPGKNINLQISDVIGGCEQDMALYKVFKLENLIDVTEYMEIEKYIPDTGSLDGQISTSLSNVVIIDGATSSSLSSLISSNNLELNPESLTKDLESGLDQLDLTTAAGQLYQVANDNRITDQTLRQQYQKMGDDLTALNNNQVSAMRMSMGTLKEELKATSDSLSSIKTSLSDILTRASSIQTTLADEGTELMTQGATRFRERLVGLAQGYVSHVQKALNNEVGQCQPLHDVYEGSSAVLCDYFAGAVNGIWMSTGIIALSLLVLLIFSLCITKYYRPPSDGRKVSRDELACSNSMFDLIRGKPHRNNNSSVQSPSRQNAVLSGTDSDRSCTSGHIKPHQDNSAHMDETRPVMAKKELTSITHVDEIKPKSAKKIKSVTFVEKELPKEKDISGTVCDVDDDNVNLGHKVSNSATHFDFMTFVKQVRYSVMMPETMIQDIVGVVMSYILVLSAENTSTSDDVNIPDAREDSSDTIITEGNITDTEDDTVLEEATCEPDADGDSFV